MTLLLASGNPHLPQVVGGVEINTHEMALELNRRGRKAAVLSKLSPRDLFGAVRCMRNRLLRSDVSVDRDLGYEVYRSRRPWIDLRGMPMPRIAVIQNGSMEFGNTFARHGVPSVAYLHGLGFESDTRAWCERKSDLPFRAYIANSRFTAKRFRARFGIAPHVIPPMFRPELYRATGERRHVTFINPVPEKGVELAFAIAERCPEIPFRFIKGWPIGPKATVDLVARARRLSNVELSERTGNMRPVYGATRVLLVPSQCEETWGRVVSEAQFSGIPALASRRGGLPEAVGPGGTIIAHNAEPEIWAAELRRLWHDKAYYALKSEAALEHSRRAAIDRDCQMEAFLSIVEAAA